MNNVIHKRVYSSYNNYDGFYFINNNGYAIDISYVGPESSYDSYIFAGSTQHSRVDCNEPYGTVYWYVKGPNENGLGTLEDIDIGDDTSTSSSFNHTFSDGSTSGEEYEITAYVYPDTDADDQSIDLESYTLEVWTPAADVITVPDSLTITDDIKIGDSYSFDVKVSSSNSNYVINKIEVFVNGVSVSDTTSTGSSVVTTVSGSIQSTAGQMMYVQVKISGKLISNPLTDLVKWGLERMWHGVLRGTVKGFCECRDDGNNIDSQLVSFSTEEDSRIVIKNRWNRTRVRWSVRSPNCREDGKMLVQTDGTFSFIHQVPFGHDVTMWIRGDDLHAHGGQDRICKYEDDQNVGVVGEVFLTQIPTEWGPKQVAFQLSPNATYKPKIPTPVKIKDNWK
ncbi:hypothetical protein JT359_02115 [Candidatus Poribacteria bacterium]|nr:hypothetical protein [Candidatus Poribacteria bacterium]